MSFNSQRDKPKKYLYSHSDSDLYNVKKKKGSLNYFITKTKKDYIRSLYNYYIGSNEIYK